MKGEKESENYEKIRELPEEVKKEIEELQKNLKTFKKELLKKFPFILAIGIMPPQASKLIEEEEEVEKEKDEKLIHVIILVGKEEAKNIKEMVKLKTEAIALVKDLKPKVWIHLKSVDDLWEICFDGKYALMEAISMSFPLHDKGILGALRVASIHKMLVLKKFERYVVSYVLAGSLVRGEAEKTSDVDVYVVIDDTDVKRMPRFELKEKLRAIIYSYAFEAGNLANVKNKLNPQVYILTEFWEAVKDAHPVIFTFIRDGVPLYDRGAFMPWKLLLKMGKIKPSPEAIDMFMSLGERVSENVRRKLNEIATEDIYWGVITPSQALLMLYGIPPTTPKETVSLVKEIFVKKEKLLEPKYAEILEHIVDLYKKYEHEKVKAISGKEIDKLLEKSSEYLKRLKELMKQIEKKAAEREITKAYESVFKLLADMFGKASEQVMIKKFEEFVKKEGIASRNLEFLKKIVEAKKKLKKGKVTKHDIVEAHRAAYELTNTLLDYKRRKELIELEKKKIRIIYEKNGKKQIAELIVFEDEIFLVPDIRTEEVKKFKNGKFFKSSVEELREKIKKSKKGEKRLSSELLTALKEELGCFDLLV
ncbi:MAG TPA: hypothetical protein ENF67_00300 [Candidatus Pacearchaeota archaeon]|nr:hypothetical protein [Candidatus Pacearchaeota archaeon]